MNSPLVSVILPFYKNPLVVEAVQSILSQSLRDIELIAVDDCSGNGVANLLKGIQDPRLKIVIREQNGGVGPARNSGIELAKGRYIAFQDSDDLSYPNRLEQQVAFLESHPGVIGCGTFCHYGVAKKPHILPDDPRHLWWEMIFNSHVVIPTVMVRREVALNHLFGELLACEDYIWLNEIMQEGDFVNIPEILFHYRIQPTSVSKIHSKAQIANGNLCRVKFARNAGTECSEQDIPLLQDLGMPRLTCWDSIDQLRRAVDLLERLVTDFQRTRPGDPAVIVSSALSRMRFAAWVSARHGIAAYRAWQSLARSLPGEHKATDAYLLAKCLIWPLYRRIRPAQVLK